MLVRHLARFGLVLLATVAFADQQQIAPGTGEQDSTVIDTGADGICNTTAAAGDIQLAAVGSGSPNRTEIRCGANKIVDTIATGDDVQLVAFGAPCKNVNTPVIDTGDNGLAETTARTPTGTRRRSTLRSLTGTTSNPAHVAPAH